MNNRAPEENDDVTKWSQQAPVDCYLFYLTIHNSLYPLLDIRLFYSGFHS